MPCLRQGITCRVHGGPIKRSLCHFWISIESYWKPVCEARL